MEKFFKIFLIVTIIISTHKASGQSRSVENSKLNFSKVKTLIQEQLTKNNVPSMSIAVVYKGSVIWEESFGYANKEKGIKATINTPYYLASLTKTITSTTILELSEKNYINLDSSANRYLKNSKLSSFLWNTSQASVKKLLNHTSGLTTYHRDCHLNTEQCPGSLDADINKYGIVFWQPGDHFDYSNIGYGILGKIIEDISGKNFAAYLHDDLFIPLGMKNSFLSTGFDTESKAVRYLSDSLRTPSSEVVSYTQGASSCYSSVHDLTKFAMLHLKDKITGGKKIISNAAIGEMQNDTVNTGEPSEFYGLGWDINPNYFGFKGVLGQGGTEDGNAWMQLIPSKDIAVILLTNTGVDGNACQNIIKESLSAVLPEFKKAISSHNEENQTQQPPNTLPNSIGGNWAGKIHTSAREIKISIAFNGDGSSYIQVDTAAKLKIPKVEYTYKRIFFDIPGDLHISDVGTGPYNLGFEFSTKESRLYGAITANGEAQLPFWVELKKQ